MARKQKQQEDVEETLEEGSEPRVYEVAFHIDSELSDGEVKRTYEKIRAGVTEQGTLIAEGAPEKIQLAYRISRQETTGRRDFDVAYFSWIAYEATPEAHEAILSGVRGESRIVRFIDLKTTKEAAKHAADMRELRQKTAREEAENEPDTVSEEELEVALENAA